MPEKQDPKVLVISLGGSPEGQIASVLHHRPDLVIFFASPETAQYSGQILERARDAGLTVKSKTYVSEDPQNLSTSYASALTAVQTAIESGQDSGTVLVDITGGTKAMSAALALAAVRFGCVFSYVGGDARNKDGVGIVETGKEQIFTTQNPWLLFGVEWARQFAFAFNRSQFSAAMGIARAALARVRYADRGVWRAKEKMAAAYDAWDRFDHLRARAGLAEAIRLFEDALVSEGESHPLRPLIGTLRSHEAQLADLTQGSEGFTRPSREQVADLLANAERRAAEGKYDDAVARLYRAIELIGQVALYAKHRCLSKAVPVELIPDAVRDELVPRSTRSDTVSLGLEAVFRLLCALEVEEGKRFMARHQDFRGQLGSRNASILAHGLSPVNEKNYRNLYDLVQAVFDIKPAPGFPVLPEDC